MVLDASPWGLGGVIKVNDEIKSYYSSAIDSNDVKLFGFDIGSPDGQQTWECLNILVATKLWKEWWVQERSTVEVRADNVTALVMVAKLKGSSPGTNLIARELALEYGDGSFRPRTVTHSPGLAIKTADTLSRLQQPGAKATLPAVLNNVDEEIPPVRDKYFYQSLHPPSCHLVGRQNGNKGGAKKKPKTSRTRSRRSEVKTSSW